MCSWLTSARLGLVLLALVVACEGRRDSLPPEPPGADSAALRRLPSVALSALPESARPAAPLNSAALSFEKALQASNLRLPARREHQPRLAFGKGVFAQLTAQELRVFDAQSFEPLATEPLTGARLLLTLADGSLLAVGAQNMLRWERGKKHPTPLARPMLLPGAEVYADSQAADLVWVLDARGNLTSPPSLSSVRLVKSEGLVALPEQTIELASPRGGVFGVTREGVWLYATPGHGERFSPGGLRLPGLVLSESSTLPAFVLPARRLDQSLWVDEAGQVSRVLVSPSFKRLSVAALAGTAFSADVGDAGRLFAVTVVTGEGPRFELQLFNSELKSLARVPLPGESPSGTEDWVKGVTENQNVVVAPGGPRVAVGGPDRVAIFDAQGTRIFSIPSR
jgi:hypothetical protein